MEKSIIKTRILKSEPVKWKTLQFIQPDDFKELTPEASAKLKQSIINNNFLEPFKVWKSGKETFCLDGYHRIKILTELESENYKIPAMLNADFIDCKDMQEASKIVLIYSSLYAKLNEEKYFEYLKLHSLDFEALKYELNIPDVNFDNYNLNSDLLKVDNPGDDKEKNSPKPSDDEYSMFELVMLHSNKLQLVETLNKVKEKNSFVKIEDALMHIINNFKL